MLRLKQALDLGQDLYQTQDQDQGQEKVGRQTGRQAVRQATGSWHGTHAHREMFCSSYQCNRAST